MNIVKEVNPQGYYMSWEIKVKHVQNGTISPYLHVRDTLWFSEFGTLPGL